MEEINERKATRAQRKDRSNGLYSEEDFMSLPREEQLKLAEKYWTGRTDEFDDGTFKFSYSHFGELCKRLGFRKGVVDVKNVSNSIPQVKEIYIKHGKREDTDVRKLTLSLSTIQKLDSILGDSISNIERSKVIDAIMGEHLDELLKLKDEGRFSVFYERCDVERLI